MRPGRKLIQTPVDALSQCGPVVRQAVQGHLILPQPAPQLLDRGEPRRGGRHPHRFDARQPRHGCHHVRMLVARPGILHDVQPGAITIHPVQPLIQRDDLAPPDHIILQVVSASAQGIHGSNPAPVLVRGPRVVRLWWRSWGHRTPGGGWIRPAVGAHLVQTDERTRVWVPGSLAQPGQHAGVLDQGLRVRARVLDPRRARRRSQRWSRRHTPLRLVPANPGKLARTAFRLHRLGAGPSGVGATTWRASSPGA
jgi:hypothetical protein